MNSKPDVRRWVNQQSHFDWCSFHIYDNGQGMWDIDDVLGHIDNKKTSESTQQWEWGGDCKRPLLSQLLIGAIVTNPMI